MGKPLDGISVWKEITTGSQSPRSEFIVNVDPCSGHGKCNGVEVYDYTCTLSINGFARVSANHNNAFAMQSAIRSGDWKFLSGVTEDTWYPVPTEAYADIAAVVANVSSRGSTSTTGFLYNLTADPGETDDLASKFPDVVKELQVCTPCLCT